MSEALGSRFDWYESTHDDLDVDLVATKFSAALNGHLARGKGRNGYAVAWEVTRGDDVLATVYGHSARAGEVHVSVTGESCDEVVPLLRELWPVHRVSRADSSVDVAGDFDLLDEQALAFVEGRRLKHRLVTDSEGGATRYLGAPSSEVRVRVYKKSEQLRALHPERAGEVPDGIVRYEVQVRPGKREVKQAVSAMHPDDLWGLSEWGTEFAKEALGIDAERTSTHFRRPTSWSKSLHWLGSQYGPSVAERVAEVGLDAARAEVLEALGLGVSVG